MNSQAFFVAGATGFTGKAVVSELCKQKNNTVWAHVRPDSPKLSEWKEFFTSLGAQVDTTPWEPKAFAQRMQELQPNVVFALLGTTRKRGREAQKEGKNETYQNVDYGLTVLLAQAVLSLESQVRFVYLSSTGVKPNTLNPYMKARADVEAFLQQHKNQMEYVIARPSFIVGDRDVERPMEKVGAVVIDSLLALVGLLGVKKWQQRYQSTDNLRLAKALIRHATCPESVHSVVESEDLTP